MAAAAESSNVTIQYCMSLPRHILQSASFPRVTQARASHDYGQSRSDDTEQWVRLASDVFDSHCELRFVLLQGASGASK